MAANEGKKDLWICIPHQADDEYIRKLAQLCKYGSDGREPYKSKVENPVFPPLDPELNLYVEYSNEIWNFQFSQTPWCREQGKAHGHPLNFDGESDEITLMFRFKAMRSVQMSLIFRSVFGDKEMMSRVRPVICWQQGYEDLINRTLSFVDRYYGGKDSRSDYGKLQDVKTTTTIQGDTTITTTTGVMSNGEVKPVNYFFYGGGGTGYWYSDGKTTLTEDTIWDNAGWNAFGLSLMNGRTIERDISIRCARTRPGRGSMGWFTSIMRGMHTRVSRITTGILCARRIGTRG
jgi:hypothetical protein